MFLENNPNAEVVTSWNMLFLKVMCQVLITFPVLGFVSFVMSSLLFLAEQGQLFKVGLSAERYPSANPVIFYLHLQNKFFHKFSMPCLEIAAVRTFYKWYDSIQLT